jgi:hypothetical protein
VLTDILSAEHTPIIDNNTVVEEPEKTEPHPKWGRLNDM